MRIRGCALLAALVCAGAQAQQEKETPSEATVEAHVARATRFAGGDLTALLALCKPAPLARPPQALVDKGVAAQIARAAPAPGQAFDNLYFVGSAWVSAWALKTSEGILLIDTLNNPAEAAALIEGGLRQLGLDPAQIRTALVTHGHGDHYGGARYLVERYKTRVAMSEADWKMVETGLEFSSVHWGEPPARDLVLADGARVTLGDASVQVHLTPGHTPGTLSPVFEVTSRGRTHRVLLWGGTAFNFGRDIPRLEEYIRATQRMARFAHEQDIDVLLSNHPAYDQTVARLEALRKEPGGENPFVTGSRNVVRALRVMGECAAAQRDRFLLRP